MRSDFMQNLPREKIIQIASSILSNGDIIAKHGTSVANAQSIINTGFNFNRTSFVMQTSKSVEALCGYGWKENGPDDSTNIIIEVPKDFLMDLLSLDENGYNSWIQGVINDEAQEAVLNSLTSFEYTPSKEVNTNTRFSFVLPPAFSAHIPKEFVVGAFIWCNGKTYLRLADGESALDNLSFVSNEGFYSNLDADQKAVFVEKMRSKLGIDGNRKKR